jgi:UDP-glucuronate decarboxylase
MHSFCYVDHLVEGLVRLMDSGESSTGPVNPGNPVEFTMLDLAQSILRQVSSGSELAVHPLPQDYSRQRCPDITLAGQVLNWRPSTGLDDSLARTVGDFRTRLCEQDT